MNREKTIKSTLTVIISLLIVMSGVSTAALQGALVSSVNPLLADKVYTASNYIEQIDLYPLKNTSVGMNADFIGGEVELPFDLTSYDELQLFTLVFSDQRDWQDYSQRRFWDTPDGVSMVLHFEGLSHSEAMEDATEIEEAIEDTYGIYLALVAGERDAARLSTTLIYQGAVTVGGFEDFISDFADYVSDDGLGAGITAAVISDAPIKAMGIGIYHRPLPGFGVNEWIPVLGTAWIDPEGLTTDGTVVDMTLSNILPGLSPIEGATDATISLVTMELPYIVDVLTIDPPTDNLYPHLNRRFEWIIKVDKPQWNWTVSNSYPDIQVTYDFNITDLKTYPKVLGELSIDSELPIMGGEDLTYTITLENVGEETAYDINLIYDEFTEDAIAGITLPVLNPELTFDSNQTMYYYPLTGEFSSLELIGEDVVILQGWFYNKTAESWLADGEVGVGEEEFVYLLTVAPYVNKTFLDLDPGDFSLTLGDSGLYSLSMNVPSLAEGAQTSKSFSFRNLPNGTQDIYDVRLVNDTLVEVYVYETIDWSEKIISWVEAAGGTLHIPDDVATGWWLAGYKFIYEDSGGKEYLGITNGLGIQLYDDEAVLVGKLTLDKDIYRVDDMATFTIELKNIGNANATDINLQLYYAFITEDFEAIYIREVPNGNQTIERIADSESYTFNITAGVKTQIGLHPVIAIFGYTSEEAEDLNHPIFSSCTHQAVFSSMDFGIVIPPKEKEGTNRPTYPAPEVEVNTELIGLTNETTIGDVLMLQTEITNIGDEATNVIYIQRLDDKLEPATSEEDITITIDGQPVTDYSIRWIDPAASNRWIGMPYILIAEKFDGRGAWGIPLAVNETMIIEFPVEVIEAGEIFIPPTEIRYRSQYNMTNPRSDYEEQNEGGSANSFLPDGFHCLDSLSDGVDYPSFTIKDREDLDDKMTTNDWGSYSESLLFVAEALGRGGGTKYLIIGLGLIAVTGVAVLIYFRANNNKKKPR